MAVNQPHLEIPPERVHTSSIKVRGRAKAYARPDYSAHGDFLRERTAALRAYSETSADAEATEALFLQIRTPEELPVRGERQRLAHAGLRIVALSDIDPQTATVQLRKQDLSVLQAKVDRYASARDNTGKSYLKVIEDIGPVPIEEKVGADIATVNDEPVDCLLIFYSSLTDRERAAVLLAVRSFMSRSGVAIGAERRLSNGVTLVEARLRPSEARSAGAAFSTLRQIMPNHVFVVPDGWRISSIASEVTVQPPSGTTSVAVIDTGISPSCRPISQNVVATFPQLPPGAVAGHFAHGTFVASRVIYGDDLESNLREGVLRPRCPLVDIPVIGVDAHGAVVNVHEGHLASAIDTALPVIPPTTRVINVSLGTNCPSIDGRMSIVGQVLDKHALERDLLIVTTAGNIRDPNLLRSFPASLLSPECRIDSPGDSLLAVTVGSMAKHEDAGSLSRAREVSAFSRRGPGPFGGVKPDLVAHGGNCLRDTSTSVRIGVHGFGMTGQAWECDYGTSFAAPLVACMGAELFDHYGNPSANMVRALLLHFTEPVLTPVLDCQPEHLTGFGEPNLEAAKWSTDHAVAFLHEGELTSNRFSYLPFFVPACLAAGADGELRIKITAVINPPVAPDNHLEYAKARVTLALRKPAEVGHRTIGVSSDTIDADKWSPVTQLSRSFSRSYETGEWELQLRLWSRGVPIEFRQPYAVIIEVIDETGTQPVRSTAEVEAGAGFRLIAVRAAA